jgi:hypothetical protein
MEDNSCLLMDENKDIQEVQQEPIRGTSKTSNKIGVSSEFQEDFQGAFHRPQMNYKKQYIPTGRPAMAPTKYYRNYRPRNYYRRPIKYVYGGYNYPNYNWYWYNPYSWWNYWWYPEPIVIESKDENISIPNNNMNKFFLYMFATTLAMIIIFLIIYALVK